MSQSVITWQQDWTKVQGFVIKSPLTGQVLPLSQHPEPLYHYAKLGTSLCVKLQQGTLYAPFNARFTTARAGERRLVFTHQSGLTFTLDLPEQLATEHGKGIQWHCRAPQEVKSGMAILHLDLAYWQLLLSELYCIITLSAPVRLEKIVSREARVVAQQDPLFVLQFKK